MSGLRVVWVRCARLMSCPPRWLHLWEPVRVHVASGVGGRRRRAFRALVARVFDVSRDRLESTSVRWFHDGVGYRERRRLARRRRAELARLVARVDAALAAEDQLPAKQYREWARDPAERARVLAEATRRIRIGKASTDERALVEFCARTSRRGGAS